MSATKFHNPWQTVSGFEDLGSFEHNSSYFELYCFPNVPAHAVAKLQMSVRLARQSSRDSWQLKGVRERREHRRISREAISDARYWQGVIKAETVMNIGARFGGLGDYISSTLSTITRQGITRTVLNGNEVAIKEAVVRMGKKGLLADIVYDQAGTVIFSVSTRTTNGTCLRQLLELWTKLGDIPVTDEGYLEEDFERFPQGTDREDVWHWFESQNSDFIVGEVMQGNYPSVDSKDLTQASA